MYDKSACTAWGCLGFYENKGFGVNIRVNIVEFQWQVMAGNSNINSCNSDTAIRKRATICDTIKY